MSEENRGQQEELKVLAKRFLDRIRSSARQLSASAVKFNCAQCQDTGLRPTKNGRYEVCPCQAKEVRRTHF